MYFYYYLFKHYQGPPNACLLPNKCSTVKPLNTADLGTGEKRRYSGNGGIGTYNIQNPHLGLLKMGGGIWRAAIFRIGRGGI